MIEPEPCILVSDDEFLWLLQLEEDPPRDLALLRQLLSEKRAWEA